MIEKAVIISERDIREAAAGWRSLVPLALLAVVFPVLLVLGMQSLQPLLRELNLFSDLSKIFPFLALMIGFLPSSFSLVFALEGFAGERERRTLEWLLVTPLTDGEIYLGKFMAAVIPSLTFTYVSIVIFSLVSILTGFGVVTNQLLSQVIGINTVQCALMTAAALIVSSNALTTRGANLMAIFIITPVLALLQFEYLLLQSGYLPIVWLLVLAALVVTVLLVRLGVRLFDREAVLSQESYRPSRRETLAKAWSMFLCPTESLGRWDIYGHSVALLRQNLVALLIVVGVMLLSFGGAYGYSLSHPLGLSIVPSGLSSGAPSGPVAGLPSLTVQGIFLHNLRALLVGAVLALFSFGTFALLTVMLPLAVLGFFAGQVATAGGEPLRYLLAWVLPHGLIELPTLAIAAAFNFALGMAVFNTRAGHPIGECVLQAAMNWLRILLTFIVPLLLLSAILEVHLTPRVITLFYGP
ncbi:MAG: stage II sporulation protein M [Chloroflexi bacterium]|nr:stage II sporulation protein M [Chloroflexota bacterium]